MMGGWTEDEDLRGPDVPDLIGTLVDGKYQVVRLLGLGGMGTVYEAVQLEIDRHVALKVINTTIASDRAFLRRFNREALVISRLHHPNTVTLHDHGRLPDGRVFLVMEYLEGRTLEDVIQEGALPAVRALEIGRQLCRALAEAHDLGVVHRDLKPSNIFLTTVEGHRDWVKVLDFGIAKIANHDDQTNHTNLTGRGLLGTPRYMSPEQIEGKATLDARSDVYAIGLILYEMLAGRAVFVEPIEASVLHKHLHERPTPIRLARPDLRIDRALEALVMQCLSKAPEDRPPHARALVDRLDAIGLVDPPPRTVSERDRPAPSSELAPTLPFVTERLRRPGPSHLQLAVLSMLVLTCAGLLFALGLPRNPRAAPPPITIVPAQPSPQAYAVARQEASAPPPKPRTWRVRETRVVVGELEPSAVAELNRRAERAVKGCEAGDPTPDPFRLRVVRDRGQQTVTVRPSKAEPGEKLRACLGAARLLPNEEGLAIVEMEVGS